jgi:serine/threonine-protein kinase
LSDRPPDARFGERYERQRILGRGGQGIVYQAFDHWLGRPVAIKVLPSVARKPQMAERLIREQQALSALKGTAAVEVLDIYRGKNGELSLVMELLVGTDLEEHLSELAKHRQKLVPPRIAEIFDPIVDTLEVAHGAGILHRDLKPANIFLPAAGGVRLLDFGMARLKKAAPLTAAGTIMGSPSYIAPEAWKGQSELVDQRADVYSLGVILFRVLTGELPFGGDTLTQKFLGATTQARPSLRATHPELPRDADEWVTAALAIDRELRFKNVRALWNAFVSTFDIPRPPGRRPSFWAAAGEKLKRLALGGDTPPREPPPSGREPSFARETLAKSLMHVSDPEVTADLSEAAENAVETTLPLEPSVEKTLELSGSDLVPIVKPPPPKRE